LEECGTYAHISKSTYAIDVGNYALELNQRAKDSIIVNLQKFAKDNKTAEVHLMVAEGLYYDKNIISGLFSLPRI
jgi:hypothetical protein